MPSEMHGSPLIHALQEPWYVYRFARSAGRPLSTLSDTRNWLSKKQTPWVHNTFSRKTPMQTVSRRRRNCTNYSLYWIVIFLFILSLAEWTDRGSNFLAIKLEHCWLHGLWSATKGKGRHLASGLIYNFASLSLILVQANLR